MQAVGSRVFSAHARNKAGQLSKTCTSHTHAQASKQGVLGSLVSPNTVPPAAYAPLCTNLGVLGVEVECAGPAIDGHTMDVMLA